MDLLRTTTAYTDREWRSQLIQTNQHQAKMKSLLPWLDTNINCVTKNTAKDVDSMRTKTTYMVQHFESLCEELRKVKLRSMIFSSVCVFRGLSTYTFFTFFSRFVTIIKSWKINTVNHQKQLIT